MLVVALNGFLGDRKNQVDVTELVQNSMKLLPTTSGITLLQGRGGAGPIKFHKLHKRVARFARKEHVLCLVGKNYGAHWCTKLLWKLADSEKLYHFRAVAMVTIDPSFVLHKMQRKTRPIPKVQYAKNFHQYGARSGYQLGPPAENIAVKATHKNIDGVREIASAIDDLMMWGYAKSPR